MSAHPHPDESLLRRRARYFFSTAHRGRGEVREFASRIAVMGECAVVGGMLRDLCLAGNRAFRSDVDFVASVEDLDAFDRAMRSMGATVNRFGGYGVRLSAWQVDVWPLQRTWAAREGHAEVGRLEDVLKTTFFDWDAVLYFPADGRLAARPGYFDGLRNRLLDVNLLPNPNPLGNAVRALRYACMWNAKLTPELAAHVEGQVKTHGWETLARAEMRSFDTHHLRWLDPGVVANRLREASRGEAVSVGAGLPRDAAASTGGPRAASKARRRSAENAGKPAGGRSTGAFCAATVPLL